MEKRIVEYVLVVGITLCILTTLSFFPYIVGIIPKEGSFNPNKDVCIDETGNSHLFPRPKVFLFNPKDFEIHYNNKYKDQNIGIFDCSVVESFGKEYFECRGCNQWE